MKKLLAFLKKDFLQESSYRWPLVFGIFGVLMTTLIYYFIDRLFGERVAGPLEDLGVSYFGYVLVGLAFFSYVGFGLGSFSDQIQREQTQGTLEALLVTPTGLTVILLSMGIWNFLIATLDLLIYAGLGLFLFHIDFSRTNVPSLLVIWTLSVSSFSALGILSASFTLIYKRGNPVSWVLSQAEGLLGGVYFPIAVLPAWLQFLAHFLPITYAIRALQKAVYQGTSLAGLKAELLPLLAFCIILLPASFAVFNRAVQKARRDGTLAQY